MPSQTSQQKSVAVFAVVTFYLVAALAMVIANKWVLNSTTTPLFFLFLQLVAAVLLLLLCQVAGLLRFPVIPNAHTFKALWPLASLNILGLTRRVLLPGRSRPANPIDRRHFLQFSPRSSIPPCSHCLWNRNSWLLRRRTPGSNILHDHQVCVAVWHCFRRRVFVVNCPSSRPH